MVWRVILLAAIKKPRKGPAKIPGGIPKVKPGHIKTSGVVLEFRTLTKFLLDFTNKGVSNILICLFEFSWVEYLSHNIR